MGQAVSPRLETAWDKQKYKTVIQHAAVNAVRIYLQDVQPTSQLLSVLVVAVLVPAVLR